VDSYGLSMTIFFVLTGKHPRFGETERADWRSDLFQRFRLIKCDSWRSIPTRLARLVYRGSNPVQSMRADMTTMLRELTWLEQLCQSEKIEDIRLVIDEVGHQSEVLRGDYDWDEQQGTALYTSPSGLSISVGRVGLDEIRLVAEWSNSGLGKGQSIKKYMLRATPEIASRLRGNRWNCDVGPNFDGMRVIATRKIQLKRIRILDIQSLAKDVDFVTNSLNFSTIGT